MSRDEAVFAGLVVSFAALVASHVALVLGLAARPPRWRALVALVVPPLAPVWGKAEQLHARVVAWLASAIAYAVALWLAMR